MSIKKGKLIIVEGSDFSGKSTFVDTLKNNVNANDYKFTREPGNSLKTNNTSICEDIRDILLSKDLGPKTQTILFARSRILHTEDMINNLNKGINVICDRYILSSFAYQAYASDLGYDKVLKANKTALQMLKDNDIEVHVLIFKINKENYNKRKELRDSLVGLDAIEKKDELFFNKISNFFNEDIYKDYIPNEIVNMNIHTIDANESIDNVFNQGINILNNIIK